MQYALLSPRGKAQERSHILTQEYINHETLGRLTIRKTGEVLTGWEEESSDQVDPQYSGEAWPGHFVYEDRPIPYAEYTITANEDIYTQDHQVDADGNRTLWYAKGDVVAVVQTGDGTSDIVTFAPGRTNSTHDFFSVIHDGSVGEVIETLAARMGYAKYYLSTRFKKETGVSVGNYIKFARIERAKLLLATTDKDIAEIAEETGFASRSFFSNTGKRCLGMTPAAYRRNMASM